MTQVTAFTSAEGFAVEHVASVGSTNAALLERAHAGESGPLWLVADEQTEGRGRMARAWSSPPGNLYASVLLSDPAPQPAIPQLSFVLSLAIRDAVARFGPAAALALKWPNDLMAGGRKTAGLLLEGGAAAGVPFVVAGLGINIASHPQGTTHPATDLTAAGFKVEAATLFDALAEAVGRRVRQWSRGEGFAAIRHDWLQAAFGLGEVMRVSTRTETFTGHFRSIDDAGRLLVDTAGGQRVVSAGDVFVLDVNKGRAA